jgi:HSP20 family protein
MNIVPRRRREPGLARPHDFFGSLFDRIFEDWDLAPPVEPRGWPALDIVDKNEAVVVTAELPGIKAEDVQLTVHDNMLTISGEKKESTEKREKDYYYAERRYGSFRRNIPLPNAVNPDKVEATCRDGVLTITLPKVEQAKAKTVKVKP